MFFIRGSTVGLFLGVRGRQFGPFPTDFGGSGGSGPELQKHILHSLLWLPSIGSGVLPGSLNGVCFVVRSQNTALDPGVAAPQTPPDRPGFSQHVQGKSRPAFRLPGGVGADGGRQLPHPQESSVGAVPETSDVTKP